VQTECRIRCGSQRTKHGDEPVQVTPQKRLTSRQTHLPHTQFQAYFDKPADFLEGQNFAAFNPLVFIERHAISAAKVAAIGDGDSQIRHRSAERVLHGCIIARSGLNASTVIPTEACENAVSTYAEHWALKIRGLTIAERFFCSRLAFRHNANTGRCFPGRRGLCFEMECSEVYLKQIFGSVESKRFMARKARFQDVEQKLQTSNDFILNLERWFPFHSEEVEREQKRLLGYFRRAVESPQLAQGFLSTWIEKPIFEKGRSERNEFKRAGKTRRLSLKRPPVGSTLWLAIESQSHERHLIFRLPDIMKQIREDTGHKYEFEILRTWLPKSTARSDSE